MERSVCAHMTRFSLAPMYDGLSVFAGSYLCVCQRMLVCVAMRMYGGTVVYRGYVRGVRGRAPNRGGINEDNMSHIFGSGAGTGNEARLVWVTAAHVLVCHCPVSLCIKLADIDTCSP